MHDICNIHYMHYQTIPYNHRYTHNTTHIHTYIITYIQSKSYGFFLWVGHPRDPKGEGLFGSTLSRLKVCLLELKTMPEQLLNNSKTSFKKSKKRLFWPWKWSKWPSQRAKFWPKIFILEVIYRPFELKIHLKVRILRPKTMPKQLLNNSKTTLNKSKKRLFLPPKWSK